MTEPVRSNRQNAKEKSKALHIKDQGVYAAGGTVRKADGVFDPIHGQREDAGQVCYCDHASVFYQAPENGNGKRVMFLHGYGGSKAAWQKTPYSEGFADMFLADGYSTYLADQPMYGSAAKVSKDAIVPAKPDTLVWFTQFRLGLWPDFQEGTQFPVSKENIDQFFRMMTVSVGDFDLQMVNNAMVAALEKSGPAVLVTHSQGGIPGWLIAGESPNVTGVVALEPGTFIFPEDECPAPTPSKSAFAGPEDRSYSRLSGSIYRRMKKKKHGLISRTSQTAWKMLIQKSKFRIRSLYNNKTRKNQR